MASRALFTFSVGATGSVCRAEAAYQQPSEGQRAKGGSNVEGSLVRSVPVGLSGRKQRKTPSRRWKVRASLLNMLASISANRSMSTSLHA